MSLFCFLFAGAFPGSQKSWLAHHLTYICMRPLQALPGRLLLSTTSISHTYPPLEAETPHTQWLACLAFCLFLVPSKAEEAGPVHSLVVQNDPWRRIFSTFFLSFLSFVFCFQLEGQEIGQFSSCYQGLNCYHFRRMRNSVPFPVHPPTPHSHIHSHSFYWYFNETACRSSLARW